MTRTIIPGLLATLALVLFTGCPQNVDDDSAADDTSLINMGDSTLEASCTIDVEWSPETPGEGFFDFYIEVDGQAATDPPCWIEFWDLHSGSEYCEGYDPNTGDPCVTEGVTRPGWDMENTDTGGDEATGYWDEWRLTLDYWGGTGFWPPYDDQTFFLCEDAGEELFQLWFCCCDLNDDALCDCTMFPDEIW